MEDNHQEITQLFNSSDAQNSQVIISMSIVKEDITKLYEASKIGCVQTLKTLIQQHPYLIQKALIYTIETPLLHVSVSHGHLEFTQLLLDHNPQLAAEVDVFRRTPLHIACANGDIEIVRALLEKNTSACLVEDRNGFIPLHYAATSGNIEMMELLINARPQSVLMKLNNGKTVLHLCVEGNHLEGLKLLIALTLLFEDFLNTVDDVGNTILDLSLMLRRIEMVGYLLTIPEVKTRTSMANFSPSNDRKKRLQSQKITKIESLQRQRRESISLWTTKKTKGRTLNVLSKKLKYKGDWVHKEQDTLMLVATVIATMTFQGGVNPPGGIWQQDTSFNYSNFTDSSNYEWFKRLSLYGYLTDNDNIDNTATLLFPAGTGVMAYQQPQLYWVYLWVNTISFLASVSVILMIVGRFPLKNRICSWILDLAMCIAVVSLAIGYLIGVKMVNLMAITEYIKFNDYDNVLPSSVLCWLAVVGMVGLWQVAHFLKSLFYIFISKLKPHSASRVNSGTSLFLSTQLS